VVATYVANANESMHYPPRQIGHPATVDVLTLHVPAGGYLAQFESFYQLVRGAYPDSYDLRLIGGPVLAQLPSMHDLESYTCEYNLSTTADVPDDTEAIAVECAFLEHRLRLRRVQADDADRAARRLAD
jgi:hypothetical protein